MLLVSQTCRVKRLKQLSAELGMTRNKGVVSYAGIILRKTKKVPSQNSRYPGRNYKQESQDLKLEAVQL
jgi:hypothetical protein